MSRLPHAENRPFGSEKSTFRKAERPVNGPGRPSTGLYPLLGIYTHGRQKASKSAIFRDVHYRSDKTGQYWTIPDNSRQFWTELDIAIAGQSTNPISIAHCSLLIAHWTVPASLANPACRSYIAKIGISGAKNRSSKSRKARKRPPGLYKLTFRNELRDDVERQVFHTFWRIIIGIIWQLYR